MMIIFFSIIFFFYFYHHLLTINLIYQVEGEELEEAVLESTLVAINDEISSYHENLSIPQLITSLKKVN